MPPHQITFKNPPTLFDPTAYGFSHVSIVEAGTRIIHTAGQTPIDATGNIPENFDDQVRATFKSLKACLAEAGASLENIINLTVYVADYATNNKVMHLLVEQLTLSNGKVHSAPQAVIPVPMLAVPGVKVEIAAVAAVATTNAGNKL